MSWKDIHWGSYTDYYELTMAQGYFKEGMADKPAVFDYFFRSYPCRSGYVIFAGLADLLDALEGFRYGEEDLAFLEQAGFEPAFLDYLRHFRFRGTLYAAREGEVVFHHEPLLVAEGNILELQLIETLVLNFLNYQSLVATRASRIEEALKPGQNFVDFGMRRAHGLGSIFAARAAVIGGAMGTSNVWAARQYGLQAIGTMAHAWVQAFPDELTAFRRFAEIYRNKTVLLIDTYDTIHSGIPHAITVAKEAEAQGYRIYGVRIDSGDIAFLSRYARQQFDSQGLHYLKIISSNQLDEYLVRSLNLQDAAIDGFGIGTKLVTSEGCCALGGVYKLSRFDGRPNLKLSDDPEKVSLPDAKRVYRYYDRAGLMYRDVITLAEESPDTLDVVYHPNFRHLHTRIEGLTYEPLLHKVMEQGKALPHERDPSKISQYRRERLQKLSEETRRFENPHLYKVGLSDKLWQLRYHFIQKFKTYDRTSR